MLKKNKAELKAKKQKDLKRKKQIQKFQKKREHKTNHFTYKLGVGGLMISLIGIVITLVDVLQAEIGTPEIFVHGLPTFWFSFMHYFTNQVNILVIIYFFLFLVAFKTRLFNGHIFTMLTGSYIWIVFFIFWTILAPSAFFTGQVNYNPIFIISTGWLHLITPMYFIVFSLAVVWYPIQTKLNFVNLKKYIPIGLIYPLIYSAYVVIINFVPLSNNIFSDDFQNANASFFKAGRLLYISVYGAVTNFNHDCFNIIRDNHDMGTNFPMFQEDSIGSLWFLFMIPLVWGAFTITLGIFGYINNKFSCIGIKNRR